MAPLSWSPGFPSVGAGLLLGTKPRRPRSPSTTLDADGVDPQRLHVLAIGVALPGAEVGAELAWELLTEGVEPRHVVGVVEDEQALVVVQEDAHLVELVTDVEPRPGLRAGAVLVAVVHDDAVEAAAGLDLDAALAACGLVRQPDHPLGLLCHHHLPVVDAATEGLRTQHRHLHVEALGRVLQRLWVQVAIGHDGAVVGQNQALVGGARVQGQGGWHCGDGGGRDEWREGCGPTLWCFPEARFWSASRRLRDAEYITASSFVKQEGDNSFWIETRL